jgi:hypothetical protein
MAIMVNRSATIACSTVAIPDPAAASGSGIGGQLYYSHNTGDLIEPARFSGGLIGIAVLANASNADFTSNPSTSSFATRPNPNPTTFNDLLGPRIIIGPDNTIYLVWASNPVDANSNNGCGGTSTPLPNQVLMAYTTDEGLTWSSTKVVAQMSQAVAWWPWAAAGAPGNVSIVWYQSDQATDPDCDSAASVLGSHSTNWTVQVANIFGATTATYPAAAVNAVPNFDGLHANGIIHTGSICQSGTTCAANTTAGQQDRRLGDYFTNALDQNGCVLIATADTQLSDSIGGGGFRTGRPLFVKQVNGPSLTTGQPCVGTLNPSVPETPFVAAFAATGAGAVAVVVLARRRKNRLGPPR